MSRPNISIVIPVRNEVAYIERCLKSVLAQDFAGHRYEVLVVDGMSTDGTREKIQALEAEYKNLKVLDNPQKTVSSGVNIGIRNSSGEIIFRMDAHAEYGADYVKNCLEVLEQTGADNVGGPAIPLPGDITASAWAIALCHESPFGLGGGAFRRRSFEGYVETVWPGCFRRQILASVGLLDERLTRTEDLELNTRIIDAGGRIYLSPRIEAYYLCRTKFGELWRQRWQDGIGVVQTLAVNLRAPKLRHFVPLAFVLSLMLLFLLSRIVPALYWVFLAELGLYALAVIFFTIRSLCDMKKYSQYATMKIGSGPWPMRAAVLVPLVFIVLHLSYGLGSLWALLTLPNWWSRFHEPLRFELQEDST